MKEQTGDNLSQHLIVIRDALYGPDTNDGEGCTLQTIDFADMRRTIDETIERLRQAEMLQADNAIARDWISGRIVGVRRAAEILQGGSIRSFDNNANSGLSMSALISTLQSETDRLRRVSSDRSGNSSRSSQSTNQYENYKS
ncbi:MAG: hypothetical protein R3F48_15145 [Candidatus Zixiibacteriota bacterium]